MNIRKITAILTISALISSLCQPIFAADEGQDRKREEYLNKRALYISDQSVKLEDKEEALNMREAKLEELSKQIHEKNVALTVLFGYASRNSSTLSSQWANTCGNLSKD